MKRMILTLFGTVLLAGCTGEEAAVDETTNSDDENTEETVNETEQDESEETSNRGNGNADDDEPEEAEDINESSEDDDSEVAEEPVEPMNLMGNIELVDGHWINYRGEDDARAHMTRTVPIEYSPEHAYTVTTASYVSYFYGDAFIKTNNYGHDGPHIIESVPEANRIIVSFGEPEQDTVELINDATDDAEAEHEVNTTPDELVGRGQPVMDELAGTIMFDQEFLTGEDVFTGERIDSEGEFVEAPDYYVTGALPYKASGDYVITSPSYVSFYNGRKFIETVEFTDAPAYLPEVNGANYINISFHDDHLLDLNIVETD